MILETALRRKSFSKGSAILWEKDLCRYIYFLISGEVEVDLLAPNGREQVLERKGRRRSLQPGAGFQAHAQQSRQCPRRDLVELFEMNKDDFTDLLERLPEFQPGCGRLHGAPVGPKWSTWWRTCHCFRCANVIASFLIKQADTPSDRWTTGEIARSLRNGARYVGRVFKGNLRMRYYPLRTSPNSPGRPGNHAENRPG